MTTYVDPATINCSVDQPITDVMLTAMRDNPTAITQGAAGAPKIQQAAINAGAVGQSQFKQAVGEVSASLTAGTSSNVLLPGGSWTIGWETKASAAVSYEAHFAVAATNIYYLSYVGLKCTAGAGGATFWFAQRYVQACRPYNLGDGLIGHFVFVLVDNATGKPIGVYAAQDAPWHNNGPTDIRADYYDKDGRGWRHRKKNLVSFSKDDDGIYVPSIEDDGEEVIEITQEMKQADMGLIPHPFLANDLSGKTVVLLDPVSAFTWHLAEMHEQGISPNDLLHDDYIRVDNVGLNRAGPPGVKVVSFKWRNTK